MNENYIPKPGDVIEDCGYRPLFVTSSSLEDDLITGISLLDGTHWICSATHCGVKPLDIADVTKIRREKLGVLL